MGGDLGLRRCGAKPTAPTKSAVPSHLPPHTLHGVLLLPPGTLQFMSMVGVTVSVLVPVVMPDGWHVEPVSPSLGRQLHCLFGLRLRRGSSRRTFRWTTAWALRGINPQPRVLQTLGTSRQAGLTPHRYRARIVELPYVRYQYLSWLRKGFAPTGRFGYLTYVRACSPSDPIGPPPGHLHHPEIRMV